MILFVQNKISLTTKQRILSQARKVFNEQGYGSVNLLDLAKSLDMSRGNMTYHFKDKEVILEALVEEVWERFRVGKKSASLPSFANLHHDAQLYYELQRAYAFIFQDMQMLTHPLIASKMKNLCDQTIHEIEVAIAFSIQVGNMKDEPVPGTYKNLALTSWMLMFYWSSQQTVRHSKIKEDGEKVIWSLLLPHLTEKGLEAFKQYFGETYFNDLGEAFEQNIETYLTF